MIIVIDLDKTLLTRDTFPAWCLYCLRQAAFSNPILFLHLLLLITTRTIGLLSHLKFKMKMMVLLETSDWNEIFALEISKYVNKTVLNKLKTYSNARFVLSTAAPIQYVRHLTNVLPLRFESIFATHIENDELINNFGLLKVVAFTQTYKDKKCDVFFTDHTSDVPMMKMSSKVYLVNPSPKTVCEVKNNLITVEIL